MAPPTKVAASCRLIESSTERLCSCGCVATRLVSMNTVQKSERLFVCERCYKALPKAAAFEQASRAWIRPLVGPGDIRMVNHVHTVGFGGGMGKRLISRGNGTAALNFEE